MAYQEDLILSIYGRGEPGLAMADPLPKDDPNRPVKAPGKDGVPSSPYLPGKSPIPSRQDLELASIRPDQVRAILSSGMFIGPRNQVYGRNSEGVFTPQGKFDNKIHGNIVPSNLFSQANEGMMIAKRKKSDEERAYEDFVKDMKESGFMEEANDLMRGRQGGGLDIMQDLLDIDGV